MLHTVPMEPEVTVAYRLIGMSLSPAKKEMIVIFSTILLLLSCYQF